MLGSLVKDARKRGEDRMLVALRESGSPRPPVRVAGLTRFPGAQISETSGLRHSSKNTTTSSVFYHCSPMSLVARQCDQIETCWITLRPSSLVAMSGSRETGATRPTRSVLRQRAASYCLPLRSIFSTTLPPTRVHKLLTSWNVAAILREAGPTKRLLVTSDGWRPAGR
jgi:hypothetical protein